MGNCISENNLCNGYFDTESGRKFPSKSIEVFLDRDEKAKKGSIEDTPMINKKSKSMKFEDPNDLNKYNEILEKNKNSNVCKIQRFYRQSKIKNTFEVNSNVDSKLRSEEILSQSINKNDQEIFSPIKKQELLSPRINLNNEDIFSLRQNKKEEIMSPRINVKIQDNYSSRNRNNELISPRNKGTSINNEEIEFNIDENKNKIKKGKIAFKNIY